MGKLTIGRAGYDLPLEYLSKWDHTGERVSVSGVIYGETLEEALTMRAQILGYAGSLDEPVVPITCEDDPSIDGFYRFLGADVSMDGASLASRGFDFDVSLERIPGFAAPLIESIVVGVTLPPGLEESYGGPLNLVDLIHAAPGSATGYHWTGSSTLDPGSRISADGALVFKRSSIDYDEATSYARFFVRAADHYVGSPRLTVRGRTIVGRQILAEPWDWSLDNGLVRIRPDVEVEGCFLVDVFDGEQWESPVSWKFTSLLSGQPSITGFQSLTVLRNGPEQTVIRLGCANDADYLGRVNVDLSLRRGDRMVRGYVSVDAIAQWIISPSPSYPGELLTVEIDSTDYDFGVIKETEDADGNKPFVMGGSAFSVTGDNDDQLQQSSFSDGFAFALGAAIDPNDHDFNDGEDVLDLGLQWYGAQSERLAVVGR